MAAGGEGPYAQLTGHGGLGIVVGSLVRVGRAYERTRFSGRNELRTNKRLTQKKICFRRYFSRHFLIHQTPFVEDALFEL